MAKLTLASEAAGGSSWGWGGSDSTAGAGGITLVEGCSFTGEVDEHRAEGYLLPDKARQELESVGGAGKGKIDLEGSHKFAMVAFFGDEHAADAADIPTITATARGGGAVRLESLSWMDSIKRQFDMA